jgi:hypothetical protein
MAINYILRSIIQIIGVAKCLTLAKPLGDVLSIVVGDVFYQLVSKTLCF